MAEPYHLPDLPSAAYHETSSGGFVIPDGYEIAHYTVRRIRDGYQQSYLVTNGVATRVQVLPMTAEDPDLHFQEKAQTENNTYHSYQTIRHLSPLISENNSLVDEKPTNQPKQQTYNVPAHGNPGNGSHQDKFARGLSLSTQKRHAHLRGDGYTNVCGVYSLAVSAPVKKYNPGKGNYCCPRCGSNFTRPISVRDHFPYCVSRYGNPQALSYMDHPSMHQKDAVQRRSRGSRVNSSMETDEDDAQMDTYSQDSNFEEMNVALARTTLHIMQERASVDETPRIKTEFIFGADIPRETIEAQPSEYQRQSISPDRDNPYAPSTSDRSHVYVAQTPDWQMHQRTNSRLDSSTSTPHSNPWNIGIPGAAAEHETMDMRATAPFEGWLQGSQTPEPSHSDGLQHDGLDFYMDRRSHFTATPAPSHLSEKLVTVCEETTMEE